MCFFARPKIDLCASAYAHYCVPVLPNSPTLKFPYGIEEIEILGENMRLLAER